MVRETQGMSSRCYRKLLQEPSATLDPVFLKFS